jgi:hypothetical protein
MAYGVFNMSPKEFGLMTPKQFIKKVTGWGWSIERSAQSRAHALAVIINTCGHLQKGKSVTGKKLYPGRPDPPMNVWYRNMMGLPI